MRSVAITGVTGFLGKHLAHSFAEAGWRVIGLSRRPDEQRRVPGLSFERFDLQEGLVGNLRGVETLIHCAIEPYRGALRDGASVNVGGSQRLFESAIAQGVGKIVFISSTAARADTHSDYGREKLAIEQALDPGRDIIVRPGLIVGDGGLFRAMYRSIRKVRAAPVFFGGRQPVYTIGIDDLCAAISRLIEGSCVGTYTLAAQYPTSMRSVYELLGRKANVRVRLLPFPYMPTLWALGVAERLGLSLPISSGSVKGVTSMRYIDVPRYDDLGITIAPFGSALDGVLFAET